MNIKGAQQLMQKVGGLVTKNSPTILTGLGVAGLFTTTVMAVKATPRALEILEEERKIREAVIEDPNAGDIDIKDTIKLTYKCYIPTAIMGGVTVACIIGANSINLKRNAALAGLYSLSETALKEYKDKVVETLGKEKASKVKEEINKERIRKNPVEESEIIHTGKGDTLCYDALSGRYFRSDMESIRKATNEVSRRLMSEMVMHVNEIYYELGLRETKMGNMLGWSIDDGLIEPHFDTLLTDKGEPCIVLDYENDPRYIDLNY